MPDQPSDQSLILVGDQSPIEWQPVIVSQSFKMTNHTYVYKYTYIYVNTGVSNTCCLLMVHMNI